MNRRYGNHPIITYKKLSEASGVSVNTIMACVRILEKIK